MFFVLSTSFHAVLQLVCEPKTNPGLVEHIMKLIIQLPCYNEVETLPIALSCLPRSVEGFDTVEWLVVDDGSVDGTAEIARSLGVDHVVVHETNRGLARAFMTGIQTSLDLGADVIVNTDADNQYNADDIPVLVKPILERRAEMVIGARPIDTMPRYTPVNSLLHMIGCLIVRLASGTAIPDAPSGFRAYTRSAAARLKVYDSYTYTLETIIQAGYLQMALTSVPVRVNDKLRPSRLISSIPSYIVRSAVTIIRTFALYRPFRFFYPLAIILLAAGLLFSSGGTVLVIMGVICVMAPFVLEMTPFRRRLHNDLRLHKSTTDSK